MSYVVFLLDDLHLPHVLSSAVPFSSMPCMISVFMLVAIASVSKL